MRLRRRFSEQQLAAIRDAVAEAEAGTSGEIVTYLVERCDEYVEAPLRAALVGWLAGSLGVLAVGWWSPLWWSFATGGALALVVAVPMLLALLLYALAMLDPIRRQLIREQDIERRVGLRAEAAFLEEEVFATAERTGVLLFLALFERRAVILGDSGIYRSVDAAEWQRIVEPLCAKLGSHDEVAAVVDAIEACGHLLEQSGVERRHDDRDELANEPRLRDR